MKIKFLSLKTISIVIALFLTSSTLMSEIIVTKDCMHNNITYAEIETFQSCPTYHDSLPTPPIYHKQKQSHLCILTEKIRRYGEG